jgi:hypothetical protein
MEITVCQKRQLTTTAGDTSRIGVVGLAHAVAIQREQKVEIGGRYGQGDPMYMLVNKSPKMLHKPVYCPNLTTYLFRLKTLPTNLC